MGKKMNGDKTLTIGVMIVALGILLMIVFHLIYFGFVAMQPIDVQGKLGPVADWFNGFITPMVALASFFLLYKTYKSQKKELALTRKEIEKQNKANRLQRFENTFFQLLSLHHTIVNDILCKPFNKRECAGRSYFEYALNEYIRCYELAKSKANIMGDQPFNPQTDMQCLIIAYKEFYNDHQNYVGHYFRNVYQIVKLIDSATAIDEDEKRIYIGILRAQFSTYEFVMLWYNAVAGHGFPKFKPLIEKYDLLQNLNDTIIGNHKGYFGEQAILENLHKQEQTHD